MPKRSYDVKLFLIYGITFLLLFLPWAAHAFDVSLTWDANAESDLAGYRVFARQEGQLYDYTHPAYEGMSTSCSLHNLTDGRRYYFVARAYDLQGYESADSAEVSAIGDVSPPIQHTVTLSTTGDGTVALNPPGGVYESNTRVGLTAIPAEGWEFSAWDGAVTGSANPTSATVDGDLNISATFVQIAPVRYSVAIDTRGSGSVTLTPPGGTYDAGTALTLSASPSAGWVFSGWTGAVTSASNPEEVIVDGHKIVTATFTEAQPQTYRLTATIEGSGSVAFDPPGGLYEKGTVVTVTANPAPNWEFSDWGGDLNGQANPEIMVVNDDKAIHATFVSVNQAPIADAGSDQSVREGQAVTLHGEASSDADDGIRTYYWEHLSGSPVSLSSASAVSPTFISPDVGLAGDVLRFRLTVEDHSGLKAYDECVVQVSWVNEAPLANAGPDQSVLEGDLVTLSGLNSIDPDDGIVSYHWQQTDGMPVAISDPESAQPSFTTPNVGVEGASLRFAVTVYDQGGLQSTHSCIVNVVWQNEPPIAEAGPDQTVPEMSLVTLDGTGSLDVDDGIALVQWVQKNGPSVVLSDRESAQPTFWAPEVGITGSSLEFELTIADANGLLAQDTCVVNVTWQNDPPVAITEEYIEAEAQTMVQLDGSMSMDADDGIGAFWWTQTEGPPVVLSNPTSASPTFESPQVGEQGANLVFRLTVSDHGGLQDTVDCTVYIIPANDPADTVDILSSKYYSWRKILYVRATSDAPAGSVTLTAFAEYKDGRLVELGTLTSSNYWYYYSWYNPKVRGGTSYWKYLSSPLGRPTRVLVKSSGGGRATSP